MGAWLLNTFPSYDWQIVFMPIFATMGFFTFGFMLRELDGWKPKLTVFLALSFLATAVVADFFEGLSQTHPLNPYTWAAQNWHLDYWTARTFDMSLYDTLIHFSRSLEECLEMFAMTLLWTVFLSHLVNQADGMRIRAIGATAEDALAGAQDSEPEAENTPVRLEIEAPRRAA